MSGIKAVLESVGTWFGYVGSCVGSPDGTCLPFVAFVGLAAAATAALALVLLAYRSAQGRDKREMEQSGERLETLVNRSREKIARKERPTPAKAPRRGWRVTA